MRSIITYCLFICLVTLNSCNKPSAPDCFKQAGTVVVEKRTLPPFDILVLDANIEVTIENGNEYKAEIKGGANLIGEVKTTVNSNTLTIDNRNHCNFVRGYHHKISVKITCPNFKRVSTFSIGNILTTPDFHQDTIFVVSEDGDITLYGNYKEIKTSSHGNGNIYFKGTTNSLYVYMNGTNYLYADDAIINNYVFIAQISLADAHVNAPAGGAIDYHIWKSGNIYYKGNPASVNGKIDGTGQLIKE